MRTGSFDGDAGGGQVSIWGLSVLRSKAMKVVRDLVDLIRLIKNEQPSLSTIMDKIGVSRATAFRQIKVLNSCFGVRISCLDGRYTVDDYGIFSPVGLNTWTPDDDAFLIDNLPLSSARDIADKMGRSVSAVHNRASKIGAANKGAGEKRQYRWTSKRWTETEDDIIRKNYPKIGRKVIDLLPGRTVLSINVRSKKLRIFRDFSLKKP
jgi:hypothetical protein